MILNHVKTFYSKHQKLALMDKSPVFSLVSFVLFQKTPSTFAKIVLNDHGIITST